MAEGDETGRDEIGEVEVGIDARDDGVAVAIEVGRTVARAQLTRSKLIINSAAGFLDIISPRVSGLHGVV